MRQRSMKNTFPALRNGTTAPFGLTTLAFFLPKAANFLATGISGLFASGVPRVEQLQMGYDLRDQFRGHHSQVDPM